MWTILFDKGILTASVILAIIGSTIKYRTGTSNELIALVLTVISLLAWSAIGMIASWSSGLLSILWSYGVKRGLLSAGLAVFAWDLIHGTAKGCSCGKTKKEEGEEE